MRKIFIENFNNIGNHFFRYMLAYKISKELNIPIFVFGNIQNKVHKFLENAEITRIDKYVASKDDVCIDKHDFDLKILNESKENIYIKTHCFHIDYYEKYIDYFRSLLPTLENIPQFDENHIVINIRLGDILVKSHGDYSPVPHRFYKDLISNVNKKPVFMGQIGNDPISQSLCEKFSDAIFLKSNNNPLVDFEILRKSKIKCLSVSSFSYLAGLFGDQDTQIHMPVLGFFNKKQRSDINLISSTDKRFVYHDVFPVYTWKNSEENIKYLTYI